MGNSSGNAEIATLLAERFRKQWDEFEVYLHGCREKIVADLHRLRETYGDKVVSLALDAASGIDLTAVILHRTEIKTAGRTVGRTLTVPSDRQLGPATKKYRRRRKSKRRVKQVKGAGAFKAYGSLDNLKPYVLKAVESMSGKEHFTRQDILIELNRMEVEYSSNHVSLLLSSSLNGIKVVGKEPTGKGGNSLNVYKVTGRLGWKKSRSSKGKKK